MQQLQDSKRQRLLSIRCLSVLALIIASTVPIQAVAATATCNSDLDTRISGPGSPTDPIFLNEPITATASFKARDIAGGSHLSIPNFGFAADCNANSDGLTYDNCISPGNTVNYLGGLIVGDNCKNISNEKIKFPAPQSSFIDFIPLNGPVIIDENESCTISWEFEVTALREDSPDVPNLREVMYQATTFPLTDENEDAMCDNGLQAGESRTDSVPRKPTGTMRTVIATLLSCRPADWQRIGQSLPIRARWTTWTISLSTTRYWVSKI